MFLRYIVMLRKEKTKNPLRISLLLAIGLSLPFIFSCDLKAETVKQLYLNEDVANENTQKITRFEQTSALPNCINQVCFTKPNDIAIASDGSFILAIDSSKAGKSGIYLRKFNFSGSGFTESAAIPLIQNSTNAPLLRITLSQNNNKVAVYREPTDLENTLVQIVDLTNNSVKELKSVSSSDLKIGPPAFIDPDGKSLLAGNLDSKTHDLISIDIEADQILQRFPSPDLIQSVNISPNLKKALLTFSGNLGQSVTIQELGSNKATTFNVDESFTQLTDELSKGVNFDLSSNKIVLSSQGGNHILHFLDLENNKLTSQIFDKDSDGPTISTISPDGKTAFSVGTVLDTFTGFKVYKSSLSKGIISLLSSSIFKDGSIVLDIDITPDQSKILILVLRSSLKRLKVLSTSDLSLLGEFDISKDNADSFLILDPNGRYGATPNTNTEASVSIVSDFNLGPILRNIVPNIALVNSGTPFTIGGFVDLSKLSSDLKVCFKTSDFCANSVVVSRTGQSITGLTPKFTESGFQDIILSTKSKSDSSLKSSRYEGLFQFTKDTSTISDTFPPEITILAPKDSSVYNTRRILVLGKVDGTGSALDSILVNGKAVSFSSELTTVNFTSDVQFDNDGTFQITVSAKDKSQNSLDKTIKVTIDTVIPKITANLESSGVNQFKITGSADGTGSNISSIKVNSVPVQFTESNNVSFTATASTIPIVISVSDLAGNKNEIKISNPLGTDKIPPIVSISTPSNGQIFKTENNISVSFIVSDNVSLKEVLFNGASIPVSTGGQYSQNLALKPGDNLISVIATDSSDNKSSSSIKVTYIPTSTSGTPTTKQTEAPQEKEVITLPQEVQNLNQSLIDEFSQLTTGAGEIIKIGSALSIEIANAPPIPEGSTAQVEIPTVEGLNLPITPEEEPQIPQGFSFASNVDLTEDETIVVNEEDKDEQNTAVLVDSTGRTFVVGFAFLNEVLASNNSSRKIHRFQTAEGNPLELTTTITVPGDATLGDAKVSILNKNQSLATIPIKVTQPKEVKVGKKAVGRPKIFEPINAEIKKSTTQLVLKINGKNFLGKVVSIDGKLQKLIEKAKFFTNVTFVPSNGIKIKSFRLVSNNKIILSAEVSKNIQPGVKLFNVITPKGADIGAIVFTEPLTDGKLETTATPESLILEGSE